MAAFTLEILSMTDYFANGTRRADMIPAVPSIYVWTVDLRRLIRLPDAAAHDELVRLMGLPLRQFEGRVGPYYNADIADVPTPMSDDRSSKLLALFRGAPELARWVTLYATALQRPLYIGQTRDLSRRFATHVRAGSTFRSYLDEAGLGLRECSLAYVELPRDLAQQGPVGSAQDVGDPLYPADPDEDLDDGEDETDGGAGSHALDVLEAFLHRFSRPLLARKVE